MMNNKNEEILEKIDELSALRPEDEYQEEVKTEDPEKLEEARKKLMTMVSIKCKTAGPGIIAQIKPMVYSMNIKDCENMTEIIKKKGFVGLLSMMNKEIKK